MTSSDAATGMQLAQLGRFADALPYLENANRSAPADVPILHAVASVLQWAGRGADAAERYRIAAGLLPDDSGVLSGWARALLMLGEHHQAVPLLERALQVDPHFADVGGTLDLLLSEVNDTDAVCDILHALTAAHPTHANLLLWYAKELQNTERLDEARSAYERFRLLQPDDPLACVQLGVIASYFGDSAEALEQFQSALQIDPDNAHAWWEITLADDAQLDSQIVERMLMLIKNESDPRRAADFHDIVARYYNRIGEFAAAAAHVGNANALLTQLVLPQQRYSMEQRERETDVTVCNFTQELFDRLCNAGSADTRPVFVLGLPRSGTTLLEQMLASHPQIVGIGEQTIASRSFKQALIASMNSGSNILTAAAVLDAASWHLQELNTRMQRLGVRMDAQRVVDKLPDNYMFAGWLSIAFPHATIIHCLRDPRDVALSCWQMRFTNIVWDLELDHIAHRIEQHRRIMRHWRATMGSRLTEVRYERLVTNPEVELRRLLEAIGLDWHPEVLNFSARKGFVSSASRQQVRKPLHMRSVERWRDYQSALEPVMPRLNAIAAQDAIEASPDTAPESHIARR